MSTDPIDAGEAPPQRDTEPVAILLVDDDERNLLALEAVLESPEHLLVKARSAEAALVAVMEQDYAVIVLDVKMPGLSGIELARLIKQRKKTQHIPIILLTAYFREDEHAVLGYDAGAVDYLTKPVHPSVLRSKVGVFIDLFRKTRALAEMNRSMEGEIIDRKVAEERFRVVFEASPSAKLVCTTNGTIVMVNSSAEHLFNRTRHDLQKLALADLLPADTLPNFAAIDESGATLGDSQPTTSAREFVVNRGVSAETPAEVSFTPFQSSEGVRWLASVVDVTERKRAESALRAVNEELAAKNRALEREADERLLRLRAEAAQAEAEAANAAKDRFLAMLSHELRTPLSAVLHSVTLLDEEPNCSPEMRETLGIIRRNVRLEARLIDDLLDLARIRAAKLKLHFEPTDAHAQLTQALETCRAEIERRRLTVTTRFEAVRSELQADPARLQQIFSNLLNNAVKFTPEGGSITVCTHNEGPEDWLRIAITDTGVGLESSKLTSIFDAFEQAGQPGSAGLGLGLAICKALTEFHGGRIAAQSDGPGHGSTFSVSFPGAGQMPAPPIPSTMSATPSVLSKSLRLLVVEDHIDTALSLCRLLSRHGYEIQFAGNMASALELAKTFPADVLITDIGLPDGTGTELFTQLRSSRPHLRGVAISGFGMDEDLARSHAAGFLNHFTKPVDFSLLRGSLAQIEVEMAQPGSPGLKP